VKRWVCWICCLPVVLAGCTTGPASPDSVELVPLPAPEEQPEASLADLTPAGAQDWRENTIILRPRSAPRCPSVTVETLADERTTLQPTQPGMVTLLVFWGMGLPAAEEAAGYVGELQKKYGERGLRAFGIAIKTRGRRFIPGFAAAHRLSYPIALDDLSALKVMGKAVGSKTPDAWPSFFLIDKSGRIRAYRRGFAATRTSGPPLSPERETISENAPQGHRIEDYVVALLEDRPLPRL